MAATFATWQKVIADPNLDRRLASQVTISAVAMIISGTFFGTLDEYNALGFEAKLKGNATTSKVTVAEDWLGTVVHWAETEGLAAVGGIVRVSSTDLSAVIDRSSRSRRPSIPSLSTSGQTPSYPRKASMHSFSTSRMRKRARPCVRYQNGMSSLTPADLGCDL